MHLTWVNQPFLSINHRLLSSNFSLALASGNTAKKLFLDVPGSGRGNITSSARHVNVTAMRTPGPNGNHTKRNLISQLNSPGHFAKPNVTRVKTCKVLSTLAAPRRRVSWIIEYRGIFVEFYGTQTLSFSLSFLFLLKLDILRAKRLLLRLLNETLVLVQGITVLTLWARLF